jgi:membrane fusion protein
MIDNMLFRSEVYEARRNRATGEIRLAQPVSSTLVAVVAVVLSVALIAFIAFGSVTKKARVAGVTVPVTGSLAIAAPSTGVLVRSRVKEGQWVQEGEVLFELSTEKQGVDGGLTVLVAQQLEVRRQALAAERRLRIRQDEDKRRALDEKLGNFEAEARQVEHDIELGGRREELARTALRQYETLQKDGFMSAVQARQKQDELLEASSRLGSARRSKLQLDASRLSLRAERTALVTQLDTDLAPSLRSASSRGRTSTSRKPLRPWFRVRTPLPPRRTSKCSCSFRPGWPASSRPARMC